MGLARQAGSADGFERGRVCKEKGAKAELGGELKRFGLV